MQPPSRVSNSAKKDPGMLDLELARVYQRYGEADKANEHFAKAAEVAKDSRVKVQILSAWGDGLLRQKKIAEAKDKLQSAIGLAEDVRSKTQLAMRLAMALEQEGDTAGAMEQYAFVVKNATGDLERHDAERQLFSSYQRAGKLDGLIAKYEATVTRNPKDEGTLRALLTIYTGVKRDNGAALRVCEQLAVLKPADNPLQTQIAELYMQNGNAEKAVEIYQKQMESDPQRKQYYASRITYAYIMANQNDKAIEWAEKLTQEDSENVNAWSRLGDVCLRAKQNDKAVSSYEKAIGLSKAGREKEMIQLRLAGVYKTINQDDKAISILKQLTQTAQSEHTQKQAKRQLFDLYEKKGMLDKVKFDTPKGD